MASGPKSTSNQTLRSIKCEHYSVLLCVSPKLLCYVSQTLHSEVPSPPPVPSHHLPLSVVTPAPCQSRTPALSHPWALHTPMLPRGRPWATPVPPCPSPHHLRVQDPCTNTPPWKLGRQTSHCAGRSCAPATTPGPARPGPPWNTAPHRQAPRYATPRLTVRPCPISILFTPQPWRHHTTIVTP